MNDDSASLIVAQMLYLHSTRRKRHSLYINSPRLRHAGLSIYDRCSTSPAMSQLNCIGQAASMGGALCAGAGKRNSLPNSRIMIHQPLGGMRAAPRNLDPLERKPTAQESAQPTS